MPVAFTGKYWQITGNTGKYDLQPWNFWVGARMSIPKMSFHTTFRLVISIIEVTLFY